MFCGAAWRAALAPNRCFAAVMRPTRRRAAPSTAFRPLTMNTTATSAPASAAHAAAAAPPVPRTTPACSALAKALHAPARALPTPTPIPPAQHAFD